MYEGMLFRNYEFPDAIFRIEKLLLENKVRASVYATRIMGEWYFCSGNNNKVEFDCDECTVVKVAFVDIK